MVLKYEQIVPYGEFNGRRAEKLFFDIVRVNNPKLVNVLHDSNTAGLYAVSQLYYMQDNTYWIRIATTDEQTIQALKTFTAPYAFETWSVLDILWAEHDWVRYETVTDVIERVWLQQPKRDLFVEVASPTSIKSQGILRAFPDPILLFRSLYERWHKLGLKVEYYTPPTDIWELFIQHYIMFRACPNLKIVHIDHKHNDPVVVAFIGSIHLQLLNHNTSLHKSAQRKFEHYDATLKQKLEHINDHKQDLYRWVHLLAHLGFYSGVGVKTGWGMGMMRVIDTVYLNPNE